MLVLLYHTMTYASKEWRRHHLSKRLPPLRICGVDLVVGMAELMSLHKDGQEGTGTLPTHALAQSYNPLLTETLLTIITFTHLST